MSASTGKTIGIILLAILILAVAGVVPLLFAPMGFMTGTVRFVKDVGSHLPGFCFTDAIHWVPLRLVSLALLVLWIFVMVWVYRDAESRGMNGLLWALLVFIGNIIGLIIYLIVRNGTMKAPPSPSGRPCPECGKHVHPDHAFCPHCGKPLQETCPKCRKPVEKEWKACPHCGKTLE